MRASLLIRFALLVALIAAGPPAAAAVAPAAPCTCCEHGSDGSAGGECCRVSPATPDHQAVLTPPPARPELIALADVVCLDGPSRLGTHGPRVDWHPHGNGRRTCLCLSVLRI